MDTLSHINMASTQARKKRPQTQARYNLGKPWRCKIDSVEKPEIKDIGYPIPNAEQNQFELDRLFTKSHAREDY